MIDYRLDNKKTLNNYANNYLVPSNIATRFLDL